MKKGWIVFLTLLAVCILAIGVWYFFLSPPAAKITYLEDADALYRYGYLENKDGVQLVVEGEVPEGQSWSAATDAAGTALVRDGEQEKDKTFFSVQGVQTGTARITLTLQAGTGAMINRLYRVWINVRVLAGERIEVVDGGHEVLQPAIFGGNEEYQYLLNEQTDTGTVTLCINRNVESAWEQQIDGNMLQVTQTRPSSEEIMYTLVPLEDGETTLTVYSRLKERTVTVVLQTEDGVLHIVSHQSSEEVFKPRPMLPKQDQFEQTYGVFSLPEGAQLYDIGEKKLWCMEESTGWMQFELNGQYWELYVSDDVPMADVAIDMIGSGRTLDLTTVDGKIIRVYQYMQRTFSIWENAKGRSYLFMGEYVQLNPFAKALETVKKTMEA